MTEPREFFTVVFEGRLSDVPGNPFKVESPFGKVVSASMGDAVGRQDVLEDLLVAADKAVFLADHCMSKGIHSIEIDDEDESVADLSGDLMCAINVARCA